LCLPALLAGFKKRNYPEYKYERTASIWPTREDLLEYEEALYIDVEMENPPEDASKTTTDSTPVARFKTPMTPAKGFTTPLSTPQTDVGALTPKMEDTPSKIILPCVDEDLEFQGKMTESKQRAKHATKLYKERIEAKWKGLLMRKDLEKGKEVMRPAALERFEAGECVTIVPLRNAHC
jgi:Fanconi-associated nuclease 1